MPVRSWRRLHGTDLVVQVDPVPGFGTWAVRAWAENGPVGESSPHQFPLLTFAQAAADHMVGRRFKHRCTPETCGDWLPWDVDWN